MLTVRQAAAATGRTISAIQSAIARGRLPVQRYPPHRAVLINPDELATWAATAKVGRPRKEEAPA